VVGAWGLGYAVDEWVRECDERELELELRLVQQNEAVVDGFALHY
jgi:hypothetical protein